MWNAVKMKILTAFFFVLKGERALLSLNLNPNTNKNPLYVVGRFTNNVV